MTNKTSIIVVALDTTLKERQMTGSCIGAIETHTNREDYELILVDQMPFQPIGCVSNLGVLKYTPINSANGEYRYQPVVLDKLIETKENIGLSAAYNLGAKNATGKYLVFMHNDVFVPDNWLPPMIRILNETDCKCITPNQGPTTREDMVRWSKMTHEELLGETAHYDAGLLVVKTEDFLKTKGWDEDFKIIYPGKVFVDYIIGGAYCTPSVTIIHLGARLQDQKLVDQEGALLHARGYINQ